MPDFADYAQALEMTFTETSIQNTLSQNKKLTPTGSCYYCGSEVGSDETFCDSDCLKDYEYEEAVRKKQGVRQ